MARNVLPRNEDGALAELKFRDCEDCSNVNKPRICRACDNGESFDTIGPMGVDEIFAEVFRR